MEMKAFQDPHDGDRQSLEMDPVSEKYVRDLARALATSAIGFLVRDAGAPCLAVQIIHDFEHPRCVFAQP